MPRHPAEPSEKGIDMTHNHRIDAFAKALAVRRSRRTALRIAGAGIAGGLLGVIGQNAAAQGTPAAAGDTAPAFLFVQTAASGTFTPNPDAGTGVVDGTPPAGSGAGYLLTLEGHHGGTIYFSDHPDRIFGDAPTEKFLDGLGFSPANPPNAALVVETASGETDVVVLELIEPAYDQSSGTIVYGATILAEYEGEGFEHVAAQQVDGELPESFDRASLFIDDCTSIKFCVAYTPSKTIVGEIPGAPYTTCFDPDFSACVLCHPPTTNTDLIDLCAQAYPDQCGGHSCLPSW
jgi:hypothetical protein